MEVMGCKGGVLKSFMKLKTPDGVLWKIVCFKYSSVVQVVHKRDLHLTSECYERLLP